LDYHVEYNNANCKPLNLGDLFGHIQPFVGYSGSVFYNFNTVPSLATPSLPLQTVVTPVNNSLSWSGTTPISLSGNFNFNGLIALNFVAPNIVNLDCCSGTVYFCFKVRVKDVNCNVCEKEVCGSAIIPKTADLNWTNEKAKDQFILKSLETGPGKPGNGAVQPDMIKKNKPN
jgi:hypothetical protein